MQIQSKRVDRPRQPPLGGWFRTFARAPVAGNARAIADAAPGVCAAISHSFAPPMKRSSRWKRRLAEFSLAILALVAVAGASALIIRFAPPWLVSTEGLTGAARLDELNRIRIALVLIVLGALGAAVVLLIARRASLDRRELQHDHHLIQRFARAVDQIGHPALDVRLGGLYSLERLAQESPEDHVPVIEILAAFVREHAPWPPRVGAQSGDGHKLAPAVSHPAAAPAAIAPGGVTWGRRPGPRRQEWRRPG